MIDPGFIKIVAVLWPGLLKGRLLFHPMSIESLRSGEWERLRLSLPSVEEIEAEATLVPQLRNDVRVYPSVIASRGQQAPRFILVGYTRDELPPTRQPQPPMQHIGWLFKRGGGTSIFGSKAWKRRRFLLLGSVLRYFKS